MWRLVVTQNKKSEFTSGYLPEEVIFEHENIIQLTSLIESMERLKGADTKFKLEKKEEANNVVE